jgi:Rieske 2Fe-2S family protein
MTRIPLAAGAVQHHGRQTGRVARRSRSERRGEFYIGALLYFNYPSTWNRSSAITP